MSFPPTRTGAVLRILIKRRNPCNGRSEIILSFGENHPLAPVTKRIVKNKNSPSTNLWTTKKIKKTAINSSREHAIIFPLPPHTTRPLQHIDIENFAGKIVNFYSRQNPEQNIIRNLLHRCCTLPSACEEKTSPHTTTVRSNKNHSPAYTS